MNILNDRVERGAELLDSINPHWADKVDCEYLCMESIQECVLGQCYGDFDDGVSVLSLSDDEAISHGFAVRPYLYFNMAPWDALRDSWIPLIESRQGTLVESQTTERLAA